MSLFYTLGLIHFVCLCLHARSNSFCVSLFYTLGLIHFPFCVKFLFVVVIITFLMSSLFYMTFYQNCRVTSYYFVVLLKQTTQVQTLSIAHVTQFHDSHPSMSQAVSHSRDSCSSTDHSFWYSWSYKPGTLHCFSWYFPFRCKYLYTNTTYSHSDHRPHHIISQFCTVFNQNICLCLP